jgi:membrane-associated phospholipid phosphatase
LLSATWKLFVAVSTTLAVAVSVPHVAFAQTPSPDPEPTPATPVTPPAQPVPVDDDDIDIITAAGTPEKPPPRKPSIVLAPTAPKVRWNPRWQKFEVPHYIATGGFIGLAIAGVAIPKSENRWATTNEFDLAIRDGIRFDELDARNRARDASDIGLTASLNFPLIDTFIVTWWGHDNGEVAFQMALINIETLAINSGLDSLVSALASRQRPYGTEGSNFCVGTNQTELSDCRSVRRYRSFYSGHTSTTFTVAGLTCMHHSQLPLYGAPWADATACVSAIALAGTTGVLRMVADQHWMSDVLVGAAMGTFNGLVWPYVLHYRTGDLPDASGDDSSVKWSLIPTPTGANLTGLF